MTDAFADLITRVQRNCDISDARFAREYTLCIYLLKMRELYRWEKGYGYEARLPKDELGRWLTERELHWEQIEDADFQTVDVGGQSFDPFESEAINDQLAPEGLVYSGGYGPHAKPLFFLGRLEELDEREGHRVFISGRELARDITAPPAMSQANSIFIRRESVRRMLWEKLDEWQWRKGDTPMGRAIGHYGFDTDINSALDHMTAAEIEFITLHELGEMAVRPRLGEAWEALLVRVARTRWEYVCRAVRDHLADATVTLPKLIERRAGASMHFYVANLTGLRKELFPALTEAYERWNRSGDWDVLWRLNERAVRHWQQSADTILALAAAQTDQATLLEELEAAYPDFYFLQTKSFIYS